MNIAQQYKSKIIRDAFKARPLKADGSVFDKISRSNPHEAQKVLLAQQSRFNVAVCGRRFGKTELTKEILLPTLKQALPCAYFAPTYKMLSLVWKDFKSSFYAAIAAVNVQEKRLEFKNGSSLDFWSLDSFDSVRGRKYACGVIDEAAMVRDLEEAWLQVIRPTLTDYAGKAWFLSTPKGMNYFYMLYSKGFHGENGWVSWQYPTSANPYISKSEIESARQELPSLVFQQEYLAEFVEMAGTLIKREYLRTGSIPSGLEYYMGVDLAISTKSTADYTAIAVLGRDSAGIIYLCDVARARLNFHDAMDWILTYADKWNVETINVEQTQYQAAAVQELLLRSQHTVWGVKPKKDKVTRFMGMQARYEQGQVIHSPSISDEYEKELLAFPYGEHDDMVDAVSYAYMSFGISV
jgi:predicted phage terminase large subunit-like protein